MDLFAKIGYPVLSVGWSSFSRFNVAFFWRGYSRLRCHKRRYIPCSDTSKLAWMCRLSVINSLQPPGMGTHHLIKKIFIEYLHSYPDTLVVWNTLVGGLEHFFHVLGRIIPTDELIFFRGVGIPPSSTIYSHDHGCKSPFSRDFPTIFPPFSHHFPPPKGARDRAGCVRRRCNAVTRRSLGFAKQSLDKSPEDGEQKWLNICLYIYI